MASSSSTSSSSYLKTLQSPLQVFSTNKSQSTSSSTLSSMKVKTLIHTLIISHVCRIVRALSKAKVILVQVLRDNRPSRRYSFYPKKATKKQKKIFFGSFRLHYNWCSSHVLPVPAPVLDGLSATHLYYDCNWNSVVSTDQNQQCEDGGESRELSGYLQWLEDQKVNGNCTVKEEDKMNEIDRLADMFIADCHEKFRLEKQESYRRFQEMLARSM